MGENDLSASSVSEILERWDCSNARRASRRDWRVVRRAARRFSRSERVLESWRFVFKRGWRWDCEAGIEGWVVFGLVRRAF